MNTISFRVPAHYQYDYMPGYQETAGSIDMNHHVAKIFNEEIFISHQTLITDKDPDVRLLPINDMGYLIICELSTVKQAENK